MKVCDKTCIFCFFPIINNYLCMAKRSLLSRCPSHLCMFYVLSRDPFPFLVRIVPRTHTPGEIDCASYLLGLPTA